MPRSSLASQRSRKGKQVIITAKIICASKLESGSGDDRTVNVTFQPDYADERNKEWARWTPGLSLTMGLRGSVADQFEVNKPYTLQFVEEQ